MAVVHVNNAQSWEIHHKQRQEFTGLCTGNKSRKAEKIITNYYDKV